MKGAHNRQENPAIGGTSVPVIMPYATWAIKEGANDWRGTITSSLKGTGKELPSSFRKR